MANDAQWLLVLPQVPSTPSRHRVAVWRELRKAGAVPVAAGTWALPAAESVQASLQRAAELCQAGGGRFAVFEVTGQDTTAAALLADTYSAARADEWAEFAAECGKYEIEIIKEFDKSKFTFGELEEEEQSLDRLRRWYRDLKRRDLLGLRQGRQAADQVKSCEEALERYAEQVYEAMHGRAPSTGQTRTTGSVEEPT